MLRGTSVDVVWNAGITLEALIRGLAVFSSRHGLILMPPGGKKRECIPPYGQKPFRIHLTSGPPFEIDDLITLCPFNDPTFYGVYWELFDTTGREWFWLSVRKESLIDGRVGRMAIALDEGYFSLMREEDVPNAIAKYHQLKELFQLLDADVLRASCRTVGAERFRFAKEGRQIFIGPMEQRRRPRPEEEQEGPFKIVVEPPQGRPIA